MIDVETHPISVIYALVDRFGFDFKVSFSEYFYRPQSVLDQRTTYDIPIGDVTPAWVSQKIDQLKPGWELAMNSQVVDKRGRKLHVPMIDFVSKDHELLRTSSFEGIVGKDVARSLFFFDSGKSFHAYGTALLRRSEWQSLMGRLLLLNIPGQPQLVDSRWIGHRLIGGYSALRWSANSDYHKHVPKIFRFVVQRLK